MAETYLQRLQRTMGPVGGGQNADPYAALNGGQAPARQQSYQPPQRAAAQPAQQPRTPQTQQSAQGAAPGTAAAGANQQATGYTPQQFLDWQKSRYGRAGTEQENAPIAQRIGAGQGANGTYTQQQWEQAQQFSDEEAKKYGWQAPAQAAAPAAPATPNPGEVGHQGRVAVDPGQGYQANQLNPFQALSTGNVGALSQSLMERILANPESMSPDVVNQMKAAGRDTALNQAEQLRQNAAASLAGRGFSAGGGMQAAAGMAVDQNLLTELLNTNRATDIEAAQTNFNDRLNAVGAGSAFQNDAMQRALGVANTENQRFQLNEGARQAQSDDDFRRRGFQADQMFQDRGAILNEFLGRSGVTLDNRRQDEQTRQFNQTFGFDVTRFLDDIRRDNRNFGEGSRQFNVNAGLNTAQLQQQANDSLLRWLQASGMR